MRIVRSVSAVLLAGAVLLGTGCGGGDQTDGQQVTPTEEVIQSRAATENALRQKPNMYAPSKKGGQSGRR